MFITDALGKDMTEFLAKASITKLDNLICLLFAERAPYYDEPILSKRGLRSEAFQAWMV